MKTIQKPPVLLLYEQVDRSPTVHDWRRANDLFEHPHGCDCSTCSLVAKLGRAIRDQEGLAK